MIYHNIKYHLERVTCLWVAPITVDCRGTDWRPLASHLGLGMQYLWINKKCIKVGCMRYQGVGVLAADGHCFSILLSNLAHYLHIHQATVTYCDSVSVSHVGSRTTCIILHYPKISKMLPCSEGEFRCAQLGVVLAVPELSAGPG